MSKESRFIKQDMKKSNADKVYSGTNYSHKDMTMKACRLRKKRNK